MIPDFPCPDAVNPYVSQTPSLILEREFESSQFNITGTTSELFLVYPPPQFTEASFLAALSTFRYLRWKKIRWRIQGACSPFVYGWFGLTCLPNDLPTRGNTLSVDFGYMSHCDSVIVDMSSASETIIEVPWLFNTEWLDLDRLHYISNSGANVYSNLTNLNGLKLMYLFQNMHSLNSTVPTTYTGSIFCKMIGVEVAGPRAYRIPSAPPVEYQMFGAAASYAAGKVAEHVIPAAKKNFDKFVETSTSQGFSAASDWVSSFMTTEEASPEAPLTQEKSSESSNVIPNVFGSMNISPSVNVLGQGTNVIAPGKARKHSILKEIQKPSFINTFVYTPTTGVIQFIPNPFISGLPPTTTDVLVQRSCSRIQFFGSMHRWWRGSINYTFVFISSPMVIWKLKMTMVYGLTTAGPSGSNIIGDVIGDVITVKGTTTHTMTVPYLATNPWCPTHVTSWEFQDPANQVGEVTPAIVVNTLIPPISSGDQVPLLYVLIFENAGPDFKFASPQELRNVSASGVEYQMRVSDLSSVRAPAQGSPYVDRFGVDSVMNVEDLAKKWSVRQDQNLRGPEPCYSGPSGWNPFDLSLLDGLSTLYFYWRGQMKFKFTIDPTYGEMIPPTASIVAKVFPSYLFTNPLSATVDSQRFGDGCHVISSGLTQCMTLTLPFTSNAEYLSTLDQAYLSGSGISWLGSLGATNYQYLAYVYTDGSDISLPIAWLAVAAGDDFSFAYPMPPPYGAFRWYNATPPDSRSPQPLTVETKSAGFKHDRLVRPIDSVSLETSELLIGLPSGIRRLTSLEKGTTAL
jgi:hypothetical protein